ncbi:Hypothetical predicted protein [Olea europaea subsp. europaea]|uniref:Uncharacterized protein n=1 Tax=Olea europaea subsp. europaea TaxID=158383 RepID=A0A8S0SM21_OLEEU|nr:Hypothetical predicted protein [Olea europaea subsp. europaea]
MEGNLDKDTALKNDNGRPDNDENDSGEKMNIQGFEQTSPKEEVEIPECSEGYSPPKNMNSREEVDI